ncbi:RNA-binding protein 10, partial [Trichonephila inaurata madagascariensis]
QGIGRFERGEERTRGSREETFTYRETDINPEIFSGPITGALSQSSSRNQFSGNFGRDCYSPDSSHERKSRRDSYSYDDEERRSRRHERDRYDRDRDYDRGRDRSRERDRGRDRGRDRSYDRDEDRRNRDRERMISRERDWREEIPNNTLMVRGLDVSVTENDIQDEVLRYGLKPKDIRLIKEKGTGASRGFAFVEFQLLSEAVRWKELTKGVVIFHGSNRASLHYSIPKDLLGNERHMLNKADWDCPKCGMNNFKRRDYCFKCGSAREDNFEWQHGDCYNEISSTPSNTLLFGNLDVLTTEGRVLAMLGQLTTLPIKSLRVAKDSLTNTSRGYAFVELNSTSEAIQLYELLLSMGGNFYVDGRQVTVSYAKRSLASRNSSGSANAAIVALAAAQWTNQKQDDSYDQYYGASSSAAVTSSTADATQFSTLDTSVPNQLSALFDTGSSLSFLNEKHVAKCKSKVEPYLGKISMANSSLVAKTVGICKVNLKIENFTYKNVKLLVIKDHCRDVLIGRDILNRHSSVEIGSDDCRHLVTKSRRHTVEDINFMALEVQKLLQEEIIEPSYSPCRAQASVIRGENHKPRTISQVPTIKFLSRIVRYIVQLLKRVENSRFLCAPFGVTNGVAYFQRVIDKIIEDEGLVFTYPFIDDVTVWKRSERTHDDNLEKFMTVAKKYNLTLNEDKCTYSSHSVHLLGYIIQDGIIKPDPEQLKPLRDMPVPKVSSILQLALGMLAHYCRWIPGFSQSSSRKEIVFSF